MNDEQQMQVRMAASVAMAVQDLTNEELAVLNMHAQVDWPTPDHIYKKVSHLFENDVNGKMHTATKEALAQVVNHRLAGNKK
jgi:hypothetical protein